MKCGECANMCWFGDYALNYCRKTGNIVTEDKECDVYETEGEVKAQC